MKVTHKIDIHLDDYQIIPEIVVMQCDANTRELQFSLHVNKQPWQAPSNAKLYVSYRKPDGTGGFYDTLPDGTSACIVGEGNTITAILAEQVLTVPGKVHVAVSIQGADQALATFSVQLRVMPNPGVGAMKSEDYFCLKAAVDAAVVAAQKTVRIIEVSEKSTGGYSASLTGGAMQNLMDSRVPVVCYWAEKGITAYLTGPRTVPYVFTSIHDGVEYQITFDDSGVDCAMKELAMASDIPQKTSDLENDSGFLTKAPVTSVNGQTGDIKLPAVVKVTVAQQSDGSYESKMPHADILAAYNAGNIVCCEFSGRLLPLIVASKLLCSFCCVHSGNIYTVNVTPSSTVVSTVPLASDGDSGSGADGITPHIGANGNWFIGETDTGMPSRGEKGEPGSSGVYVGSGEMPEGYSIQIDPNGKAPVLVQSVNGVKPDENGNVEVPGGSGGGNASVFHTTITSEQEVNGFTVQLPTTWGKFHIVRLYLVFPGGLKEQLNLYSVRGDTGYIGHDNLNAGTAGVQLLWQRATESILHVGFAQATYWSNAYAYAVAKPTNDVPSSNTITLYSHTDGVNFPAGSSLYVWGLYEQ